ncbi:hypothetical protein F511_25601 [Dorcoceras hygrometricum]|uniref:Uncharacterized protein n=1 Tax=Dorcoceras hygrometricum TaxID=472368 RepID=A0A2Z7CWW0_9LAMI|nr:hypothetical protein F511_25601 [Dorcoceras hygrometricum]
MKEKDGIVYQRPENPKPSWLKNMLDKDKAKAGSKSYVQHQSWSNSSKAKSGWRKTQPRRDLYGQHMKSKLNRFHCNYAQTLKDTYTGKTVKVHGEQRCLRQRYRWKAVRQGTAMLTSASGHMFTRNSAAYVNWSKVLFNVLKDMVDKAQRKAKGFAAQIGVLLKGIPAIALGEGVPFPFAKILSMKTVHTYIATNTTIDAREEQWMVSEAIVKRKSKSTNKSSSADDTPVKVISEIAGSKKRVAAEDNAPAIPKKRRTVNTKPSPSQATPCLIGTWRWTKVCTEIIQFSKFGCMRPVREDVFQEIVVYNLGVERLPADFLKCFTEGVHTDSFVGYFGDSNVQSDLEIDSDFEESYSDAPTVYCSPSPSLQEADSFALGPAIFSGVAQEEQLYYVQSPVSSPAISLHQESSSSSTDVSMHFNSEDISLNARTDTQPSAPVDFTVFTDALEDLRLSMSQRIHDSNCEILSKINSVEIGVREALLKQNDLIRQSLQNARRDHETQGFSQVMHINDLKKGMLAQVGPVFQDLMDIKRSQREQDAKITALDGQVAAIRNEQLDFQSKIAADLLSLSTQFGDIVDYIRGGDAKKGEGSSSRPPHSLPGSSSRPLQPPPADQIRDSGHVSSLEELEEAAERLREADRRERERDRQRRERRLSRSGAFKRRRGY